MREYIDLLTESVGLANRKAGETFKNPAGDLITFSQLVFFPDSGAYDDTETMQSVIDQIESQYNTTIQWSNVPNKSMLAFGVVKFDSEKGPLFFGRYYKDIKSVFTANQWPNNQLPGDYAYNKASSTKMQSGMMPQDILTKMEDLTAQDIVNQIVAKFGKKSPLSKIAVDLGNGNGLPMKIPSEGLNFVGFRDYFCELLQPIALAVGSFSGNGKEAEQMFLGDNGFATCAISFSTGKNTGLYDSLMTNPEGRQVKVSTKGGAGAAASIKNLVDGIEDIKATGRQKILKKYADVVEIVQLVQQGGQAESPLLLAMKFDIINSKEADLVRKMKNGAKVELTKRLQKIYDAKANRAADPSKTVPYYNMLASLAEIVASHVNDNTNFSDAAADILNSSALIQVYTDAVESGGFITLRNFRTVYPSKSVAGVKFSASKTYYGTGIKGNFTFKLLKAGESATDQAEVAAASASPAADLAAPIAKPKRVDIRPTAAPKAGTPRSKIGRERR